MDSNKPKHSPNKTQQESPKKTSNLQALSPNEHKKEQKYYCCECKMEIDSSTRQLCGKYACYNS
jgi:hypothetical protein